MIPDEEECPACKGVGGYDIGDCEDGVWGACEICDGTGRLSDE